jgi:hypothetical protein
MRNYFFFVFTILFTSKSTTFAQVATCGATANLPINSSCVNQAFTNNDNGAAYNVVPSCGTTGRPYSDIWYTITGTGGNVTITVSGTNRAYSLAALQIVHLSLN